MKKLICIALCLVLATATAGCTGLLPSAGESELTAEPTANIPNPIVDVDGSAALAAAGVRMDAPAGATGQAYSLIGGTLAQVKFTFDGVEYTYRASVAESDISGVYDEFTDLYVLQVMCDGYTVDAKVSSAASGGKLVGWAHEGVTYCLWAAENVADEALKTVVLGVMVNTFGASAAEETGFTALDFSEAKECNIDLDGDGYLENVKLETLKDEYDREYTRLIVSGPSGSTQSAEVDAMYISTAIASDFDGDGLVELFISGDVMSNDYETWCFHYEEGALTAAAPYYKPETEQVENRVIASIPGNVEAVEENLVRIGDTVDILGSWWCKTEYALSNSGFGFERAQGSVWAYDYDPSAPDCWEYGVLVTKAEFPVRMDGTASDASLPIGTKLKPTETDGKTYLRFITMDGAEGVVNVTFNEGGWGYSISGMDENDCFETVPYAG